MKWALLIIASVLLAVFQASFLSQFSLWGVAPNLILISALLFLIFSDFKKAVFFAFCGGLFLDFLSLTAFGQITASLVLSILLIEIISRFFKKRKIVSVLILGAGAVMIKNFIFTFLSWIFDFSGLFSLLSSLKNLRPEFLIIEIFYSLAIILLCLILIGKINTAVIK